MRDLHNLVIKSKLQSKAPLCDSSQWSLTLLEIFKVTLFIIISAAEWGEVAEGIAGFC